MFKQLVSICLFASLVWLVGCSDKASKETGNASEMEENIQTHAVSKHEVAEKELPVVVKVVDPSTQEVIREIVPKEMDYYNQPEMFQMEIEQWARELARGDGNQMGYDQRMVLDKIDQAGQIRKGQPQIILEETELVERIMEASQNGGVVELPVYVTESGYDPEEVPALDDIILASYTTYFDPVVAGRTTNIQLSANSINNTIIGVEDIFSFNTTIGPSDAAHGYQPAKEIVNKKLVDGIGGGICQTSSTLFNAIDQVGVSYIERHHHSLGVGYVPKGRDATVSWGGVDFQFQNTTGVPFLLKAYTNGGSITVEVRSKRPL
jgi:vancomycin resistance protein YoaR